MLRTLSASAFRTYVPSAENEFKNCYIELGETTGIELVVRCASPVVVNAISQDGETLFLATGCDANFSGRLVGYAAVEIVAKEQFSYSVRAKSRWLEIPDPRRLVVSVEDPANKPLQDLVAEELKKYIGRLEAQKLFATDVDVAELLEDIDTGDLDFDAEPDMFGLGYEEFEKVAPPDRPKGVKNPPPIPQPGDREDEPPLPLENRNPPVEPKKPASEPVPAHRKKQALQPDR